ncbi:MAG: hypothetical protein LBT75_03825 [Bacilli bacterium]|jgi:predicted outer membrane repeat protein|nr:hypothetical protein [Bacilli bacterium]
MKRNKMLLLLLIMTIIWGLGIKEDIKADTYQVSSFSELKYVVENLNEGSHVIEIENDLIFDDVIFPKSYRDITIKSKDNLYSLTRADNYHGKLIYMYELNSSLTFMDIVIDGNKDNINQEINNTLFQISDIDKTITLNIGQNVTIQNHRFGSYGSLINKMGGILNIYGNAKIINNEVIESNGLIQAWREIGDINIYDDVEVHDNLAIKGSSPFMLTNNNTHIYGNVKFYNNKADQNGGVIKVYDNGNMVIDGQVEFYNNESLGDGGSIINYGTLVIGGNVKIHDNMAGNNGGALGSMQTYAHLTIKDNVQIYHNTGKYGGGAIIASLSDVKIEDNVQINDNNTNSNGGAMLAYSVEGVIKNNVQINNNRAGLDGGALKVFDSLFNIKDDVILLDNEASNIGGAIAINDYSMNYSNFNISDKVLIKNNRAHNGGAIHVSDAYRGLLRIDNNVEFINNEAYEDGGALYMMDYHMVMIAQDVIFSNNKAKVGYNDNLEESDLLNYVIYNNNIKKVNHTWSNNRTYGFNNFDINYQGQKEVFTIHYDYRNENDGDNVDNIAQKDVNVKIDFNNIPLKEGYLFKGYAFDKDDEQPVFTKHGLNDFMMPNHNVVLYAIYELNVQEHKTYNIKTKVINGKIDASKIVNEGDDVRISYQGYNGYLLTSINIDGNNIKLNSANKSSYQFRNIKNNHQLIVTYQKAEAKKNNYPKKKTHQKIIIPKSGNEYLVYIITMLVMLLSLLGIKGLKNTLNN